VVHELSPPLTRLLILELPVVVSAGGFPIAPGLGSSVLYRLSPPSTASSIRNSEFKSGGPTTHTDRLTLQTPHPKTPALLSSPQRMASVTPSGGGRRGAASSGLSTSSAGGRAPDLISDIAQQMLDDLLTAVSLRAFVTLWLGGRAGCALTFVSRVRAGADPRCVD
jgi:hypothetical protein